MHSDTYTCLEGLLALAWHFYSIPYLKVSSLAIASSYDHRAYIAEFSAVMGD